MIRAIDNKPLDLSDDEFEYYLQIVKEFGTNILQETFESDENTGFILLVKPPMNAKLPMGIIFFLFNVMLCQRVRELDKMMEELRNARKQ